MMIHMTEHCSGSDAVWCISWIDELAHVINRYFWACFLSLRFFYGCFCFLVCRCLHLWKKNCEIFSCNFSHFVPACFCPSIVWLNIISHFDSSYLCEICKMVHNTPLSGPKIFSMWFPGLCKTLKQYDVVPVILKYFKV